jgi:uncharacterized protein YbjT (DUF2867 family)
MIALVQGSTGAVGSELIRQLLGDTRFQRIIAISRRPLGVEAPRLEVRLHQSFTEYGSLSDVLPSVDVLFSALGISQMVEKDPARYREITYDYVLALARSLGAKTRMVFVSGQGADPSGKSRMLFARVKGDAERDLRALLGDRLTILRPGLIRPVVPREKRPLAEVIFSPIAAALTPIIPALSTTTVEIAHAMIQAVTKGGLDPLLSNSAIRRAARQYEAPV